jgi:hypothetical protein
MFECYNGSRNVRSNRCHYNFTFDSLSCEFANLLLEEFDVVCGKIRKIKFDAINKYIFGHPLYLILILYFQKILKVSSTFDC